MTWMELEIDGLRRRYGTVTALDGLTFGVPGKTTTMRAIFGVTALEAGEIRWRGKPVAAVDLAGGPQGDPAQGQLSGGQAVAVPQPSLAAAEAALRSGDLSAVLVPNTEIIVKQVPFGGVTGSVATLAQLAGLSKLIQTVPGAASAVAHEVTLPVRGLEAPKTSLSARLTGSARCSASGCSRSPRRRAGDVPVWQVAVAAALTAAGTVWMARVAVRIYSNCILKTGPRISFRQAIKESRNALSGPC